MADRNSHRTRTADTARELYRRLTRPAVVATLLTLVLCAAFVLESRGLRNLFYLTALPVLLIALPQLTPRDLLASGIARLALCYAGYMLLAALWSDNLSLAGYADLLRLTVLALLFFASSYLLALRDPDFEDRFYRLFVLAAGVTAIAIFAAAASGLIVYEARLGGFGLAAHAVIGATLYGFALLIAGFYLLPKAGSWSARLLWLTIVCLCLAFVLLSGSRGPMLALGAALAVGFALTDRRVALAIVALGCLGFAAGFLLDALPIEKLMRRGTSGHFAIWREALEAVAAHPWFGYGSLVDFGFEGKHGLSRSAHNLFLNNQLYGGIPASLVLLALFGWAFLTAARTRRQGTSLPAVLLVFGLAASLFDSRSLLQNLGREWITLWLPLALIAAAGHRAGRDRPSNVLRE